jgi:hypothetical protein
MPVAAAKRTVPGLLAMLMFACIGSAAAMGAGPLLPLTEKVELEELQTGFAGTTGTIWTVEPDGRYTIAGKVNEQLTPRQEGTLDAAQLSKIAETLAAADAENLPAEMGEPQPVNPKVIILRVGEKASTFTTAGALDPDQAAGDDDPRSRLLKIAASIKEVVGVPANP